MSLRETYQTKGLKGPTHVPQRPNSAPREKPGRLAYHFGAVCGPLLDPPFSVARETVSGPFFGAWKIHPGTRFYRFRRCSGVRCQFGKTETQARRSTSASAVSRGTRTWRLAGGHLCAHMISRTPPGSASASCMWSCPGPGVSVQRPWTAFWGGGSALGHLGGRPGGAGERSDVRSGDGLARYIGCVRGGWG